ncbi:MAG TPA: DUF3046 domain-containing protein [Jatrophihabitans sp.]
MRLTEFWRRMDEQFGTVYSRSIASDYRLPQLGATVNDALERGESAKAVWQAVCVEFDVPAKRH